MDRSIFVTLKSDRYGIEKDEVGIVEEKSGESITVAFIYSERVLHLEMSDVDIIDVSKIGDGFPKKICNVCHKLLDTEEFSINQTGKDNRIVRRPSCRTCREVIDGVAVPGVERRRWERTKPYLVRFKCPICQKVTIPGLTSRVVLDHDHTTGKVRGWICDSCNTGTGRFKDRIEILEGAIKYLVETSDEDGS